MKTRALLASVTCITVALIAGCGGGSATGGNTASVAPASSFLYVEATIDPTGAQEKNMRSILADLPGTGDPSQRIHQLLEKATRSEPDSKIDWKRDIQPWLGDHAALFVAPAAGRASGPTWGVVLETTDKNASRRAFDKDAVRKRSYKGTDYVVDKDGDAEGIVGGQVVIGSPQGLQAAVDASKGDSLGESDHYKKAIAGLSSQRVGFIYEDIGGIVAAIARQEGGQLGALTPLLGALVGGEPVVATIRAENQALVIDGSLAPLSSLFKGMALSTPLLERVPGDAWLALGIAHLGDDLKKIVGVFAGALGGEQGLSDKVRKATGLDLNRDLLDWMGDAAVFVDGDSKDSLGGGLLIQSKDPEASKLALTKIAAFAAKEDHTLVGPAHIAGATGYRISDESIPQGVYLLQSGDTVAATYGEAAARLAFGAGARLVRTPGYSRAAAALGSDYRPVLYVTVAPILRLAESFGAGKDSGYREARPYLGALDYLIAGTRSKGEAARIRLGFKPSR